MTLNTSMYILRTLGPLCEHTQAFWSRDGPREESEVTPTEAILAGPARRQPHHSRPQTQELVEMGPTWPRSAPLPS